MIIRPIEENRSSIKWSFCGSIGRGRHRDLSNNSSLIPREEFFSSSTRSSHILLSSIMSIQVATPLSNRFYDLKFLVFARKRQKKWCCGLEPDAPRNSKVSISRSLFEKKNFRISHCGMTTPFTCSRNKNKWMRISLLCVTNLMRLLQSS